MNSISVDMSGFFKGKALEKAQKSLALLNESLAKGYFVKKTSIEAGFYVPRYGRGASETEVAEEKHAAWTALKDSSGITEAMEFLEKFSDTNKELEKSTSENPLGVCACCFRAQKVKPTGTMFQHGYERPGDGYIHGGCPGSDFLPYSLKKIEGL